VTHFSPLKIALCALGVFAFVPLTAEAAINAVTVNTSRDYENAKGYSYADITIDGSVVRDDGTVGQYSVPAVIIYPRHGRGNGVGVVDWLNSAFYHFFDPTNEDSTLQFTLLATENYLFEEGYTYISVQWDKHVTEIFGAKPPADGEDHNPLVYGSIERGVDAWEILLDAAWLLKNPSAYPAKGRPARVATVLSSGYSQGAALQLELLAERRDPKRVYDGHFLQMMSHACWKRDDGPQSGLLGDCSPLPTSGNHAPVIALISETDMLIDQPTVLGVGKSGFFNRNAGNPNWRQYEMAGVSHIPETIVPLGLPNQNNADARPLFRAAFNNLTRWTHGKHRVKPPASRYFKGGIDATGAFIPLKDADGHFDGGVRLPHVESKVNGRIAGAPLGNHAPLNELGRNPFNVFVFLSGAFTRFTDDELAARYPVRHWYVRRVERAADDLAAKGYITHKDRRALIAAAKEEPLYDPGCWN
jgi:hypothetical protein